MARLDDLDFHEGCEDRHCPICKKANSELFAIFYDALGNAQDWLGKYHAWLTKKGIQPGTDGGWWSREALSDKNAQDFIVEHVLS